MTTATLARIVLICQGFVLTCFCQGLSLHTSVSRKNHKNEGILLSRQIKACDNNAECAISLLEETTQQLESDAPFIAAMEVCGKARRPQEALEIYRKCPSSERCRTLAISICGKCRDPKQALELLKEGPHAPMAGSWNAAIAACGGRYWYETLDILENQMPPSMISTLTCNAVLTCLSKAKQGQKALELINKMDNKQCAAPDRISFHHALKALIASDMVDSALHLLQEMEEPAATIAPTKQTYDIIAGALGKRGDWDTALVVDRKRLSNIKDSSVARDYYFQQFFQHWNDGEGMVKVGTGKEAYWKVGSYTDGPSSNITVAFQTNRNPAKNGIKMLFFDTEQNKKIGFLLMINTLENNGTSTLLGMFIAPTERQRGLSKVILASWLQFCLDAGIQPNTGLIHKPLLALVLQYGFGFVPVGKKGVDVEISPSKDNPDAIVLYSASAKSLRGAFSPWDQKSQKIILATAPTVPRGRKIRVQTKFESPQTDKLKQRIEQALAGKTGRGFLCYEAMPTELRRVFLGL